MNALQWKSLNQEQLARLQQVDDVVAAKQLLSAMLGVPQDPSQDWRTAEDSLQYIKDEPLWGILTDLYFYGFVFTKEQRLSGVKSSTFMAILKEVVEKDVNSFNPTMAESFARFKQKVLEHSVARHPKSTKIFEVSDSQKILKYVTDTYYRHFKLYRYNFTKRLEISPVQVSVNCVETVRDPRPLSQALAVAVDVASEDTEHTLSEDTEEMPCPETNDTAASPKPMGMTLTLSSTFSTEQEKPVVLSSMSLPVMPVMIVGSAAVAGSPSNAAKANQLAQTKLRLQRKASPEMRYQYRWSCNSKLQWGTYSKTISDAIERLCVTEQDGVVDTGGGSYRFFQYHHNCLLNEATGEKLEIRRVDPCPSLQRRREGQVAKVQSRAASAVAVRAVGGCVRSMSDAEKAIKLLRVQRSVHNCELKLMLIYRILKKRMLAKVMKRIQARVEELMEHNEQGIPCTLISVNLIAKEVKIMEQVKFEGGKAVIKPESDGLLQQLAICKMCITKTCKEFHVPNMHWRVEGHTAKSKKSSDGGRQTSSDRAKAVCSFLGTKGIDVSFLHPVGCGCFRPPSDPKTDPRRVEIHVMSVEEVERALAKRSNK